MTLFTAVLPKKLSCCCPDRYLPSTHTVMTANTVGKPMMCRWHPQQATLHSTVSTTMLSRLESLYHEKAKKHHASNLGNRHL